MVKLKPSQCLHAQHRNVGCDACAVACPQQAIAIGGGPLVDEARCDDCGRCVPACTESALEVDLPPLEVRTLEGEQLAFAACARSPVKGSLPCLHSLDWKRLVTVHTRGVRRWVVASAPCDTCPRRPQTEDDTLEARLASLAVISRSRGEGTVSIERLGPEAWRAKRQLAMPEPARRALFRRLLPELRSGTPREETNQALTAARGIEATPADELTAGPINRFAIAVVAARCSGCLACAGVCPHGAVRAQRDDRGMPRALVVQAEACTGCGLCEVACDDGALAVHHLAAQRGARLEFGRFDCPTCREVHDRPTASTVQCQRRAPPPRVLVLEDSP